MAGIIGIAVLVISSSAVFGQLQASLNRLWDIQPQKAAFVMQWIRQRLLSVGMLAAAIFILIVTLVVMLMPATTLVVPLFLEINEVHLVGSLWSVVLPFSFYPFGVYLTYIYFSTALPRDLLAAARIDGCTEFGAFRRIALPLAAPIIALVGFFSFVANWTNFFLPYVMLPQSGQYPVQVGIALLLTDVPQFNPTAAGGTVLRPELALATLLGITPVLLVFLFAQRFLVSGLLAGATKE